MLTPRPVALSDNLKTGRSINLDHGSCSPDRLCKKICYGRFVNAETAKAEGIKVNMGPVTWPTQQQRYLENRLWLERASDEQIEKRAMHMARGLRRAGHDNVRLCGMGDVTNGLAKLAIALKAEGIYPWGFSKKAKMIRKLAKTGVSLIGSVNESTPHRRIQALMRATELMHGQPTLAYMTMNPGWVGVNEVESLWYKEAIVVVFGYHTHCHKTIVNHPLVCQATNGEDVHCQQCKRCIYPRSL